MDFLKNQTKYKKFGIKMPKGVLMVGPPGVGKTLVAKAVAGEAGVPFFYQSGASFVQIYVGMGAKRVHELFLKAKAYAPSIIFIDEIDKVGRSFRGDPTAVLLEILDPEQNNKFRDYYLNFNIDLSKVVFVATANDVSAIPPALRDRMEFIELSSYTPQEKFEIAKKYLIPQELKKHGLKPSEVTLGKDVLSLIISDYTRESGVRNLRRRLADIFRKAAKRLLEGEKQKITVTTKNLNEFLEKKVFEIEHADKKPQIGQVNGLAWTSVGGDVLKIEAIRIQGKGGLQITGSLGDVMKESAYIAFSLVKVLIDAKKIKVPAKIIPSLPDDVKDGVKKELSPSEVYRRYDLHIHVPEGATPKDGPSAGITMVTAIASILTDTKVRSDVAMTGEITLSGRVLPIGGLKEKLIAAHKAGIKTALIPRKNYERDLGEIPADVKNDIRILPVDVIEDVLKNALIL